MRSKLFREQFWGAKKGRKGPKSNFFGRVGPILGVFSAFWGLFRLASRRKEDSELCREACAAMAWVCVPPISQRHLACGGASLLPQGAFVACGSSIGACGSSVGACGSSIGGYGLGLFFWDIAGAFDIVEAEVEHQQILVVILTKMQFFLGRLVDLDWQIL